MLASLYIAALGADLSLTFRLSGQTMRATLATSSSQGYLWIRSDPNNHSSLDFVDRYEDDAFEPVSLRVFKVHGWPTQRLVVAEFHRANWGQFEAYSIGAGHVDNVLSFSHRSFDSVRCKVDSSGALKEIVLRDRWIGAGLRPTKYRNDPAPGRRWCLVTRYVPATRSTWVALSEHWESVAAN